MTIIANKLFYYVVQKRVSKKYIYFNWPNAKIDNCEYVWKSNISRTKIYRPIKECEEEIPCLNSANIGRPRISTKSKLNGFMENTREKFRVSTRKLERHNKFHTWPLKGKSREIECYICKKQENIWNGFHDIAEQ